MLFRQIVDPHLAQHAYLVGCTQTGEALIIDPQRDVDRYLRIAEDEGLRLTAAAETHIHADFLSGARELAEEHGLTVYLSGEGGPDWSYRWAKDAGAVLLTHGDTFRTGAVELRAFHTPGHTPEHLSYLITDRGGGATGPMGLASGDFVFVGDTGRPDLLETAAGQQGAMTEGAAALYRSVQAFLEMDDYLQVWPGHGAGSACGKALGAVPETTVGYERRFSAALGAAQEGEERFTRYILADQPEPPGYFARMKRLNRDGPPLLGALPHPAPLSVEELGALAGREDDVTIIDARTDRAAYLNGHLRGAVYAPWGKTFPTIAGSYVDPDTRLYLIIDEAHLEQAVRDLVRVGLDDVRGFAPPQTLAAYADRGGEVAAIDAIDVEAMEQRRQRAGVHVLDVRSLAEYRAGHVPGAQLVPHTRLLEEIGAVPEGKTLLVHCGSGARAASAVSLLERHGYAVVHVNDRYARWKRAHADQEQQEMAPA